MLKEDYGFGNCKKYPGHGDYFQVTKFKITDLPPPFRNQATYDLTMGLASLTVKIFIKQLKTAVVGSGFIKFVDIHPVLKTCPCQICKDSLTPVKVYWKVIISTADHLFSDEKHIKMTQAVVNYDDIFSKDSVYHLHGLSVRDRWPERDACLLEFISHDEDLVKHFENDISNLQTLQEKLTEQYNKIKNKEDLVIIVSHPHGGPKQISLGSRVSSKQLESQQRLKHTNVEKEAQLINVEVEVQYPDGEISKKFIWQLDDVVKETKAWLLHEGGFHEGVKNWQLYLKCGAGQLKMMEDNVVIRHYLSDLIQCDYIIIK
ncbi:hypothetical protein Bpfe_022258 [Biomphalaria pfeifferi]|uniref:Uncharacterized protein n=1 Tax=Biomphalaria pfeifferi TaxID=112525 RepID=A0AAD8B5D3_BIOPF|nr:hypothetical protein Bpfe_022258 [Biomphalaria pfeifferi]